MTGSVNEDFDDVVVFGPDGLDWMNLMQLMID